MLRIFGPCTLCLVLMAYSQESAPYPVIKANQEVRVLNLPQLTAKSKDRSDVLLTSLAIIFSDREICCGRSSALEDSAAAADPRSIKDITSKLQGRHLLSDGRPIMVTVIDLAPSARNPTPIVRALTNQQALLLMWNTRLYVIAGAVFDEGLYADGALTDTINELSLLDTRYSDSRREVTFRRNTDDWDKVDGLLLLTVVPQ
jgi:hypothetical protein